MSGLTCSLRPFPSSHPPPDIQITSYISRAGSVFTVSYGISGDTGMLVLPEPAVLPARRERLWEGTCLELFIGILNDPRYWEFNLSPAGHWNVFRFDDYREGKSEEPAFTSLPFSVRRDQGTFSLGLTAALGNIIGTDRQVEIAASAVILQRNGRPTFWALSHNRKHPDFHARESFILKL